MWFHFFKVLWFVASCLTIPVILDFCGAFQWPGLILEFLELCSARYSWLVDIHSEIGLTISSFCFTTFLWSCFSNNTSLPIACHRYSAMIPSSLLHHYRHLRVTRTRLSRLPRHYYLHLRYRRRRQPRPPRHTCQSVPSYICHHQRKQYRHFTHQSPSTSPFSLDSLKFLPNLSLASLISSISGLFAHLHLSFFPSYPVYATSTDSTSSVPTFPIAGPRINGTTRRFSTITSYQLILLYHISGQPPSQPYTSRTINPPPSSLHMQLYNSRLTLSDLPLSRH